MVWLNVISTANGQRRLFSTNHCVAEEQRFKKNTLERNLEQSCCAAVGAYTFAVVGWANLPGRRKFTLDGNDLVFCLEVSTSREILHYSTDHLPRSTHHICDILVG